MKLLIKFPTRGRPEKSVNTLRKYIEYASDIANIKIIVSIDDDDTVDSSIFQIHSCVEVVRGPCLGKIGAINRDMPDSSTFDILLVASDDMIPQVRGYDAIIRTKMLEHFPDLDGVLFFNDGYRQYNLNTLVICGSKYYDRFGYIYCPEYKSLFCDDEFMDVANKLGRQVYFNEVIIKHEHPTNNSSVTHDAIYNTNDAFFNQDRQTYERRKFRNYDVSILICTISSRKNMFISLLNDINKLKQASSLSIEVLYDDNERNSIGKKRNSLVSRASGRYCAFVDDDDKITGDYFKVIEESELKYDCIALNGIMFYSGQQYPFFNSLKYSTWYGNKQSYTYTRAPNHINPIRTDIVKKIGFISVDFAEDKDFSKRLSDSNLIKTEYGHTRVQYLYFYTKHSPRYLRVNSYIRNLIRRRQI